MLEGASINFQISFTLMYDDLTSTCAPKTTICLQVNTSLGSANIETMAASIASWFSNLDALAAISTTESLSTPLAKT